MADMVTWFLCFFLQVDLFREIKFRNSKQTFSGIPVIASNMDTVGTFEMAATLAKVCIFHFVNGFSPLAFFQLF